MQMSATMVSNQPERTYLKTKHYLSFFHARNPGKNCIFALQFLEGGWQRLPDVRQLLPGK